jgi:hypothetical protein
MSSSQFKSRKVTIPLFKKNQTGLFHDQIYVTFHNGITRYCMFWCSFYFMSDIDFVNVHHFMHLSYRSQ